MQHTLQPPARRLGVLGHSANDVLEGSGLAVRDSIQDESLSGVEVDLGFDALALQPQRPIQQNNSCAMLPRQRGERRTRTIGISS